MAGYAGSYGRVSTGSGDVAEVAAWRVNHRSDGWDGSIKVDREYAQAIGDAFDSRSPVTLALYLGDDDSEEPYLTGQAHILARLPLGGGNIPFLGTGPLYGVESGERQIL